MDEYLIGSSGLAAAAVMALLLWLKVRTGARRADEAADQGRVDTLIGWPPESSRILRAPERAAHNILTLALPGQMIFAQVPLARFINVPKRYSYAEWMRRLGSHCVDFVVCDAASKVVAVVDVRPSPALINERLQRRLDRVSRTLKAVEIPLHVWNEAALPTVTQAREALAASVGVLVTNVAASGAVARRFPAASLPGLRSAEDTPNASDGQVEVTEITDVRVSTWFDELDSEPGTLSTRGVLAPR